ncbi:MAG: hypothetical protein LBK65_00360 [Tannerellaceae bacterium]|jgi:hypothetical protein|nr:hypothetical protein [Tannerellaceae bacterium]
MLFRDWKKKSIGTEISKTLLWEYDLSDFDWDDMRVLVMQRVIERGRPNDFYAAISKYGGIGNVRRIIREIPVLSPRDMNFVCTFFNLKQEDLKCYTRKQLREKLLNS